VNGTVLVDGRPAPGQVVLGVSTTARRLLDNSVTDSDGRFQLALEPAEGAWVIVRIAEPVVGVAAVRAGDAPDELDIATAGFHTVTGRIERPGLAPRGITVFLDPVAVEGVPGELADFFKQRSERVFDARFAELAAGDEGFTVRVKPGVYRVGGGYVNLDRPMLTEPTVENVVVDRVERARAGSLPGDEHRGFEVEADGDVDLSLGLRELNVDEL